jgi:hypothetical protein
VNLDQLAQMSVEELRRTANERLANLETAGTGDHGPILSEAQFYIDEIERRAGDAERQKQSKIARRDLILELVVIVLIGLELYFGIVGGNQQLSVLQKLNASADQQLGVLQKLNASAGDTAKILKSLREEQDLLLATQQQTLQLTGQMNGALQTQLGLNFAPQLTLIYDEPQKSLVYQNFGKTNMFMWGTKQSGVAAEMLSEPRIIVPGGAFKVPVEDQLIAESQRVPKGTSETLRIEAYLKTANGKKYTASYLLIFASKNDALTLGVQSVGIRPEGW